MPGHHGIDVSPADGNNVVDPMHFSVLRDCVPNGNVTRADLVLVFDALDVNTSHPSIISETTIYAK